MTVCVAGSAVGAASWAEVNLWHGGASAAGPCGHSQAPLPHQPEHCETLGTFPSEGSWKIFSVFKVPMAAV